MSSPDGGLPREVETLVIGAGQAGLAMSYWYIPEHIAGGRVQD
jgi:cation diffusion facilitator CzcD-associated flavoprotein CzcO